MAGERARQAQRAGYGCGQDLQQKGGDGGTLKISTLQVDETSDGKPATSTVSLLVNIPTKSPAVRVRFLVRDEATGKLGAINYALGTANPAR